MTISAATEQSYAWYDKAYQAWCRSHGRLARSIKSLAEYLVEYSDGRSPATVYTAYSAIVYFFRQDGIRVDSKSQPIRAVLEEVRGSKGRPNVVVQRVSGLPKDVPIISWMYQN